MLSMPATSPNAKVDGEVESFRTMRIGTAFRVPPRHVRPDETVIRERRPREGRRMMFRECRSDAEEAEGEAENTQAIHLLWEPQLAAS